MTFIMTVYANEGIVMASDSRLTVSRYRQSRQQRTRHARRDYARRNCSG